MDITFEMNTGFFSQAVKSLLAQLESKLEEGIIHFFNLEDCRSIIYNDENLCFPSDDVSIDAKKLLGLTTIEVWFCIKNSINSLFNKDSRIPNLNNLYNTIIETARNGIKRALGKYHDAFSVYIIGKANDILSGLYLALDNVDNQAGQELRKSISAALNIILDENGSDDIITRIRKAGFTLLTGIAGIITNNEVCSNLYQLFIKLLQIVQNSESIVGRIIDYVTQSDIAYFKRQKALVEEYNAELMRLDLDKYREQTQAYEYVGDRLASVRNDDELNYRLKEIMHGLGIQMSWERSHDTFDAFMKDRSSRMHFE